MANISAQASAMHTLTQDDITNSFAIVHINWPSPFYDTNYTPTFSVEDLASVVDLSFEVGDIHNLAPDGFDAIVYMTAAAIPILQGQVDLVDSTSTLAPITLTAPITTLYQVTFYYGPASRQFGQWDVDANRDVGRPEWQYVDDDGTVSRPSHSGRCQ